MAKKDELVADHKILDIPPSREVNGIYYGTSIHGSYCGVDAGSRIPGEPVIVLVSDGGATLLHQSLFAPFGKRLSIKRQIDFYVPDGLVALLRWSDLNRHWDLITLDKNLAPSL